MSAIYYRKIAERPNGESEYQLCELERMVDPNSKFDVIVFTVKYEQAVIEWIYTVHDESVVPGFFFEGILVKIPDSCNDAACALALKALGECL